MASVTLSYIRLDLAGKLEHITDPPLPELAVPSLDSAETPMTNGKHGGGMRAHTIQHRTDPPRPSRKGKQRTHALAHVPSTTRILLICDEISVKDHQKPVTK